MLLYAAGMEDFAHPCAEICGRTLRALALANHVPVQSLTSEPPEQFGELLEITCQHDRVYYLVPGPRKMTV